MIKFHAAILFAAILAAPVSAGSLSETHVMRWAPSGKVPSMTFHPVKRACSDSAGSGHIAGKTAAHVRQTCHSPANEAVRNDKPQSKSTAPSSIES
jgi:hypothetical protein